MLLAGVLAAAFAWWWNFNRGRQALDFFGAEAATLIRTAPRVEYVRPPPEENIDISQAPGLINARTSLLSDASYEWGHATSQLQAPLFVVRFSQGERSVEITFDFENRTMKTSSTGRSATLTKKTAEGWQAYLARQVTFTR
jgi:hypothetical protein